SYLVSLVSFNISFSILISNIYFCTFSLLFFTRYSIIISFCGRFLLKLSFILFPPNCAVYSKYNCICSLYVFYYPSIGGAIISIQLIFKAIQNLLYHETFLQLLFYCEHPKL